MHGAVHTQTFYTTDLRILKDSGALVVWAFEKVYYSAVRCRIEPGMTETDMDV
jgi:hypothetical protein